MCAKKNLKQKKNQIKVNQSKSDQQFQKELLTC